MKKKKKKKKNDTVMRFKIGKILFRLVSVQIGTIWTAKLSKVSSSVVYFRPIS